MKPPSLRRALVPLVLLALLAGSRPSPAQTCNMESGVASGVLRVGDGSTPPCDLLDLWAIPETGSWIQLGKFTWGETAIPMQPGTWRFAAYACGTYFQFHPSAPVRCVKDAQGCVSCRDRFDLTMYAMFGGFSGQVTLLPEDMPAGPGIAVGAASGLNCGAEKFGYTDEKGRFEIAPTLEPHRANHWGLMVDGDGSARGMRTYFMNADFCENGVTATTFSSTDVDVNLFRAASYMAANDPSIRPLPHAPLLPAMPPHEAGPGISVTTGNVGLDQADLQVWGAASSLAFVRSYNSRLASHRRLTPLGPGWSHTYSAQISTPAEGILMLNEDDGAPRYFQDMDGDGTFRPSVPVTEGSRIQKTAGGYARRFVEGGFEEYDARGRLLRRVDAGGRGTMLTYEGDRLATVVDADGRRLRLGYDGADRLVKVSLGDEEVVRYTHDSEGRLLTALYADGNGFAFVYDGANQLLTVAEPTGRPLRTYTYDGPRAKTFEISGGRDRVSIDYTPLKTTVTDVLGRVTTYEWSNIRGLRLVTAVAGRCPGCGPAPPDRLDPAPTVPEAPVPVPSAASSGVPLWSRLVAAPWPLRDWPLPAAVEWPSASPRISDRHAWTYDLQGRLLSHRDGSGAARHIAYDANGQAASVTDDLGRKIRLTRDASNRIIGLAAASVVDSREERSTSYTYDDKGRLSSKTEKGLNGDGSAFQLKTTLGYDEAGRLARVDGPRPDALDTTLFTYDPAGNLFSTARAEWLLTRYADHTAFGAPRRVTDANNQSVLYAYDPLGRVLSEDHNGDVTTYAYTGSGRLRRIQKPRGNGVAFTYDAFDRLVESRNAAEQRLFHVYDMAGQRLRDQVRTPSGGERDRSFEYDRLGRLQRVIVTDGRYELGYDGDGRIVSFRAPGSDPELFEYDRVGRLAAQRLTAGGTVQYSYDARDSLAAATDSTGGAYGYVYDDLGRVSRMLAPSGAATLFTYGPTGHVATRVDGRGVTTTFERDPLGRVLAIRMPRDRSIVFTYDRCPEGRGRLCEITDQTGRTTFAYTPKGQLMEEVRSVGTATFTTGYSYDRNGNLSSVRYPSGRVVTYSWDEADRGRSISTAAAGPMQTIANLSYGPDGALSGISYANGVSVTLGRDAQGRVRTIRGAPFDLAYAYDARGNISGINVGEQGQTFGYGPARRMTSASGGWGSLSWSYDEVGNRRSETSAAGRVDYTYDPRTQRLKLVSAADMIPFGHDAAGRIVRAGDERFIYDDQGQLVMVGAEHRTGEYGYDYKGRRVWKSANGNTTVFTYDAFDRLIAESTRDGKVLVEYVYDRGAPIARAVGNEVSYVHLDGLGRPMALTDAKAQKIWELDRRPFGDPSPAIATPTPTPTPAGTPRAATTMPAGAMPTGPPPTPMLPAGTMPVGTMPAGMVPAATTGASTPTPPSPTPARATPATPRTAGDEVVFNLRAGGQYYDEETGLQRSRQRTYDPALGRYLEPNPCARPGRWLYHNLYAYAGQNPLTYVSPRGVEVVPASEEWAVPATLWDSLLPAAGGISPECGVLDPTAVPTR